MTPEMTSEEQRAHSASRRSLHGRGNAVLFDHDRRHPPCLRRHELAQRRVLSQSVRLARRGAAHRPRRRPGISPHHQVETVRRARRVQPCLDAPVVLCGGAHAARRGRRSVVYGSLVYDGGRHLPAWRVGWLAALVSDADRLCRRASHPAAGIRRDQRRPFDAARVVGAGRGVHCHDQDAVAHGAAGAHRRLYGHPDDTGVFDTGADGVAVANPGPALLARRRRRGAARSPTFS